MQTTFTDTPENYDGFSTKTVRIIGTTRRGPVRQVETPDEHVTWQRMRYASGGCYLYATREELPRVQSMIELLPGGPVDVYWVCCPNCEREQRTESPGPGAAVECKNCGLMIE